MPEQQWRLYTKRVSCCMACPNRLARDWWFSTHDSRDLGEFGDGCVAVERILSGIDTETQIPDWCPLPLAGEREAE